MIFHDIEQNTDEWLALRGGKLTGSGFGRIMPNFGKAFGDPAKKYATTIAVEQITGQPISSDYSNAHMERGHEQEPIARMRYEDEFFCDVTNGGFFDLGNIGVSPDGLVCGDGVIEIKSVIASVHYASIKRQTYDPAYKWQLVGNLFYTQRDWIDFVSFCADFPEDKRLYVCRVERDDFKQEFEMLQQRVSQFFELVEQIKTDILNSNYNVTARAAA